MSTPKNNFKDVDRKVKGKVKLKFVQKLKYYMIKFKKKKHDNLKKYFFKRKTQGRREKIAKNLVVDSLRNYDLLNNLPVRND